MTVRQLEVFNTKIAILYDREKGTPIAALAQKYEVSEPMIRAYLKLARNNHKIIQAVEMRKQEDKRKELNEYK